MLLAVGTCFEPYSLVALDIFFRMNPEPIHALGEVHWAIRLGIFGVDWEKVITAGWPTDVTFSLGSG
jgi:hypothetical protein